jgi:hypothetical protein
MDNKRDVYVLSSNQWMADKMPRPLNLLDRINLPRIELKVVQQRLEEDRLFMVFMGEMT